MRALFSAFAAGFLFALGLGISGMTLPSRVTGFLDVAGAWNPSLAFVMMGALAVHAVLLRIILQRKDPFFGGAFQIPTRKDIDRRLVFGAAIFGIGWGLAGYCPGPALVSLVTFRLPVLVLVAAMAMGMMLERLLHGSLDLDGPQRHDHKIL